jgi:hypothetical protein
MPPRTVAVSRRPRTPVADVTRSFHEYLYNWKIAKHAADKRDKSKGLIKNWFEAGADGKATINESGSQVYEFDEPLLIDGTKFLGLENVRRESSALDLDKLDDLIDSLPEDVAKKVKARVTKKVVDYIIDPDELFALNQEKVITDEQLDGLYTTTVTWALGVKKD